jgi:hypothetical protein
MGTQAMTYEEASRHTLADAVARILKDRRPISIAGPGGIEVELRVVGEVSGLEPLETLPGAVRTNWKDAVYGPRR